MLFLPHCTFSCERLPFTSRINYVEIFHRSGSSSCSASTEMLHFPFPSFIAVFLALHRRAAGSGRDPRRRLGRPLGSPCLRDEGRHGQRLEVHGGPREGLGGKCRPSARRPEMESVGKRRGRTLKSEWSNFLSVAFKAKTAIWCLVRCSCCHFLYFSEDFLFQVEWQEILPVFFFFFNQHAKVIHSQ